MSYTPRPEDLEEAEMSAELKAIADGVLPGNRERTAEQLQAAFAAGRELGDAMQRAARILGDRVGAIAASEAIRELARQAQERHTTR